MKLLVICSLALVLSWSLVALARRYALARLVVDHPNDRSSHVTPTPRGGGAGLIVALMLALVPADGVFTADWRVVLALVGVLPTAIVGWVDDHRTLTVRVRLTAHVASALLLLPLALAASATAGPAAWLISLWWVFATLSAINVVNFMDGIDGIIGLQAVVFGIHLVLLSHGEGPAAIFGAAFAGAAAGFLLWNWSPARIFLGDVGSGALGALGVIGGLLALREGRAPVVVVFLPLLPLFLDATVTMVRRARRGERVAEAHRSHLYQRLANGGMGHAKVASLYGCAAALGSALAISVPSSFRWLAIGAYVIATVAAAKQLEEHLAHRTSRSAAD